MNIVQVDKKVSVEGELHLKHEKVFWGFGSIEAGLQKGENYV